MTPRIRATFPPLRDVSPVVLDNVAILARLRGEVGLYTPPHIRRERGPAVTFCSMPRGDK